MPSASPRTSAMLAATAPASSDVWAPQMTRLSTSRPNSSVPIRCAALGGCRSTRKSWRVGLYGATLKANRAARTTTSSTMAPARPARDRTKRLRAFAHGVAIRRGWPAADAPSGWAGRLSGSDVDETATSGVADPRIQRRVRHIDHEVDQHYERRDDQHCALNDGVVAGGDRGHDVP